MKILEYDEIQPLGALNLSLLGLDYALTPEVAAHIRKTDPRPFPCLAIYAVDDDVVVGQTGIFRLPVVTTEGREDVGGVWAVCTHPNCSGRSMASRLLEEAHARMQTAGLRFSVLSTARHRAAYSLYREAGYVDTNVFATALARWETAHQPTRLQSQPVGSLGYNFVDSVFEAIASSYLGFTWRHAPFAPLRDEASIEDICILWENDQPAGYAIARVEQAILKISSLLLKNGIDSAEAVAAVASGRLAAYVQVIISRPAEIASLQRAGFQITLPDWSAFMLKPLIPGVTYDDARRLLCIGTDRFLISWLDIT